MRWPNPTPGLEFSICKKCLITQSKGTAAPRQLLRSQSLFHWLDLLTETWGNETTIFEFSSWTVFCSFQAFRRPCLVLRMASVLGALAASFFFSVISFLFYSRKILLSSSLVAWLTPCLNFLRLNCSRAPNRVVRKIQGQRGLPSTMTARFGFISELVPPSLQHAIHSVWSRIHMLHTRRLEHCSRNQK